MIEAVVFDLDGVIVDTEQVWEEVRAQLIVDWGGRDLPEAQQTMMGMSSGEWSRYMHEELALPRSPAEIVDEVVRRMLARYREALPLVDGAVAAVRRLGTAFPLAVASSSNRRLIDVVLETAGIAGCFAATVSSGEVDRGKPAPDVYLEAARRLEVDPRGCVAVEDSAPGILSARSAGMRVVAYPNAHFPPAPDVLAFAWKVVDSLDQLTVELIS